MNDKPLWPPQQRAISQVTDALADGHRRICLAMPTGAGKSRVACELIRDWLMADFKVSLYTNRKMLIEQLMKTLSAFGLKFGVRAAGHEDDRDMPLQISSIQTEGSRVLKKKRWRLHEANRVLIDEAHLNAGDTAAQLIDMHIEQGASIVGLTATPLDIGHMYEHLIVPTSNAELRGCGALIAASHYGPDEPDCRRIKKDTVEFTEADVRKVMQVHRIFGRVLEWFEILNPSHKPTILFAPGVPESIWFAEEFSKRGIEAAHIDGQTCFYKGERHDSGREIRDEILRASRDGEVKIICNRFVLREGIDAPWLAHGIFATIFGSLQSYLQSGGRLLRNHHSMDSVTIQDHGGNWWRHGSLNADREWELGDTERIVQGLREERIRSGAEREPFNCPACHKIMVTAKCGCGFQITKRSRPVMMDNGVLKEHGGSVFKPRFTRHEPNTQELWEKMYFRSKNGKGKTFTQARGLFFYENGYWPPGDLPYMPKNDKDWFAHVKDVPRSELT
jgi:superfamily II DNA or RNA helicase